MTDLNCPPYTVPGWLDENGEPTSCVGDHPCPGLIAPECTDQELPPALPLDPITIEPVTPPQELAETGIDFLGVVLIAVALVILGSALLTRVLAKSWLWVILPVVLVLLFWGLVTLHDHVRF